MNPTPGLLQWVEATEPLNSYLVGRNHAGGAHMRYQPPGEWSWMQCYMVRAGGWEGNSSNGVWVTVG